MSTAPRPHTKPSTISPPNGSRLQPSGFTGTTSVWPMSSSVGASGSVPSIRATRLCAPGLRLVALDVEPAPAEVPREQVDAADLVARRDRAVVHALVADELLQEVGDLGGRILGARGVTLDPTAASLRPRLADGERVELGERVLDAAGEPSRGRGPTRRRRSTPKWSCPQYERTATLSVRFRDSGTTGYTSSICAPRQ